MQASVATTYLSDMKAITYYSYIWTVLDILPTN